MSQLNFGSLSSSSSSSESEVKSAFDLEYVPTSKAADYTVLTSGYFTIDEGGSSNPNTSDAMSKSSNSSSANFWQMIIASLTEEHSEGYSLHNTLSDSVVVYATGARPISVSISGYVLFAKTDDHLFALLKYYVDQFRARHFTVNNKHLTFVSQDTRFKLIIQSIAMQHDVQFETYVPLTISGIAYEYRMDGSNEPLNFGYYGKNGKVVSAAPMQSLTSNRDSQVMTKAAGVFESDGETKTMSSSQPKEGRLMQAPYQQGTK